MAKQFDVTTKHLIEAHPADWLALAGLPPPVSPGGIHVEDSDLSVMSAAADKVIRVDASPPYVAHLEFQAGADRELDLRTLLYNVLCRHRLRLKVRSVAFLLRPQALATGVIGAVREIDAADDRLEFAYRLIRVWELPVQSLLDGGLGTLPLAPISAVREPQLPAVIDQMRHRLESELPAEERRELWTATEILLGLRYHEQVTERLLKGIQDMEESATYQAIIRKGRERGLLEGRTEGLALGERQLLLRLGTLKFGPPAPAVAAALEAITDPEHLSKLGERLLNAGGWDELLA